MCECIHFIPECCRAPQPPLRDVLHEENKAPSLSMDKAVPYQQFFVAVFVHEQCMSSCLCMQFDLNQNNSDMSTMMNIDCQLCRSSMSCQVELDL